MAENSEGADRAESDPLKARAENRRAKAEVTQQNLEGLTDWELIATSSGHNSVKAPMEMSRRLKDAILGSTEELSKFQTSSDKLSGRVVWLNGFLLAATLALLALTIVLVVNS